MEKMFYGSIPSEQDDVITSFKSLRKMRINEYADVPVYSWLDYKTGQISNVMPAELEQSVNHLGTFIYEKGYHNQKIGILAENSYEWVLSMQAIVDSGNIVLLLDKGLETERLSEQLDDADCVALFTDSVHYSTAQILCDYKNRSIFSFDSLDEYLEEGKKLIEEGKDECLNLKIDDKAISFIMFTSGTTGKSKGVMLTQFNLFFNINRGRELLKFPGKQVYVLPFNHIFGLGSAQLFTLLGGDTLHICKNLRRMFVDFEAFKPEVLMMVPMFINLLHDKIWAGIRQAGDEQKVLDLFEECDAKNLSLAERRQIFKDYLAPLGGEVTGIVSGGAALGEKTVKEFANFGITICEGYGITECSPVLAVNASDKVKPGSVGRIIAGMEVMIDQPDSEGNGEICAKGPTLSQGYYKMPDKTAESFVDGWFHTGDKGYMDEDYYLYIVGRYKNLIILSNGENVSPEEIESLLYQNELIKEVVVYEKENAIHAMIFINKEYVETKNIEEPEDRIREFIDSVNQKLAIYKRISVVEFTDTPFEKTSTQKIKRDSVR